MAYANKKESTSLQFRLKEIQWNEFSPIARHHRVITTAQKAVCEQIKDFKFTKNCRWLYGDDALRDETFPEMMMSGAIFLYDKIRFTRIEQKTRT